MTYDVANTILAQLGGRKFLAMTGAKDLLAGTNFLAMHVKAQSPHGRIRGVKIHLRFDDTYDVTAYDFRGVTGTDRYVARGVYAEQLRETFEAATGLATSL